MRMWFPLGSKPRHVADVQPGTVVAWPWTFARPAGGKNTGTVLRDDHFAPWRVVAVDEIPEDRWTDSERATIASYSQGFRPRTIPRRVILRRASAPWPSINTHHTSDVHLKVVNDTLQVFADRYPVCSCCGLLVPCRKQWGEDNATDTIAAMDRYSTAGVCPSCQEPVTTRQRTVTFPNNLHVPLGPPVTFHTRRRCTGGAIGYEDAYVKTHPDWPRLWPKCSGMTTAHVDGTYSCTTGRGVCPGPHARHATQSTCRDRTCPAGCAGRVFGCRLTRGMGYRDDTGVYAVDGALLP